MNIVKLQNDLKDLSDQQLLSSMQTGSAPQYLVLAEMQRRKKMRDEAATQAPQNEGTVADEIMGGIAAIPMGSMDMASGGLVSFARGGYAKGEAEACWENPETGEKMCPPSKPNVEYPKTGQRKKMAGGGIVALQAGGTPSEARAMLAGKGVDTTGMSDEEVMNIAATYAGVMVPNVDVAEPTPDTGFSPVPATEAPLPPAPMAKPEAAPMAKPEPAPKAEPSFMDTITSGITSLLGMGEAKAEEATPAPAAEEAPQPRVEYPVPSTAQMEDPTQARQWLGENAPAWYDPSKRSDKQVLEDIKSYAPGGYREGQKQRDAASEAEREARVNPPAPAPEPQPDLPRVSPEGVGVYAQSAARATDPDEKARLMATDAAWQRSVEVPGSGGWRYDAQTDQYFNPEGRLASYSGSFGGSTRKKFESGAKTTSDGNQQQVFAEWLASQKSADPETRDDLLELYKELRAEREESKKGAKSKGINEALMRMGMAMMASKNPDFMGALGEGGLEGLKAYGESQKAAASEQELALKEAADLLAARESSLYKGLTGQSSIITGIQKEIERLSDPLARLPEGMTQQAFDQYRQNRIKALEARLSQLLQVGALSNPYGLSPTTAAKLPGITR